MRKFLAIWLVVLTLGVGYSLAQLGPVPALPDAERRTEYTASSSTGPFAVGFALYGDGNDYQNWVQVYVNGLLNTQWTMSSPSGVIGNLPLPITDARITFTSAQSGLVEIVGARRPRRLSQLSENRGVSAHDFNLIITDIIAMLRENWDRAQSRVVQAPPGETMALLPPRTSRMNQGAIFDPNGNLTAGLPVGGSAVVSAAMQPVVACATLACATSLLSISAIPVGAVLPYAGFTAPASFDFAYGQPYSRTNFPALLAALTSSQTGTCTSGSGSITGLTDTSQFGAGQRIEGSRIPSLANTITAVNSSTSITVSGTATSSGSCTVQIFPYGNGDGLSTFNLPDFRSVAVLGRGNMGGTDRGLVTSAFFGASPNALGAQGGAQSHTMTIAEMASHTHTATSSTSATDAGHTHPAAGGGQFAQAGGSGTTTALFGSSGGNVTPNTGTGFANISASTSTTVNATGGGAAHSIMPPETPSNYIIRVVP